MKEREITDAFKGRILWAKLKHRFGDGGMSERYIIFASDQPECNVWGIVMLRDYIRANDLHKIVILAKDKKILDLIKEMKIYNLQYYFLTSGQMTQLMRYYALMDKSDVWKVVSVKEPYNTGAERMIGKKGITYKEIVFYDIYEFSDIEADIDLDVQWLTRVKQYLMEEM